MAKKKPLFSLVVLGSAIVLVSMTMLVIVGYLLNFTAGWGLDPVFQILTVTAIGLGIIPSALFILLSILGMRTYETHGKLPGVLGLITAAFYGLIIPIGLFFAVDTYFSGLVAYPQYAPFYVVIIGSLIVAVFGAFLAVGGSIRNLSYSMRS